MNIVYVNLSPQKISNEQIHSFLSELVDDVLRLPQGTISIKNAEDRFPGVNSYFKKILSFYCTETGYGVAGVDVFFNVLNNHRSINEVKSKVNSDKLGWEEDEATYRILDEGFKAKYSFKNSKIVVVSGYKYRTFNPYGDAIRGGNICINSSLKKYSIWHETAHLFDASDHYDENSHLTTCGDEKCFMQWDAPLKGEHFCKQAESEIRSYLKSGCNR